MTSTIPPLVDAVLGAFVAPGMLWRLRDWIPGSWRWTVLASVTCGLAALAFGVGWRFGGDPTWCAWWWLGAVSTGMAVIDVVHHRLPHAWSLTLAAGGLVLLGAVSMSTGQPQAWLRSLAAPVVIFAAGCLLHRVARGHVGFGDVGLATGLAPFTSWTSWSALVVSVCLGQVLVGVCAIVGWASQRRRGRVPAGPGLIAGAWIAVVLGP